MIHHLRKSTEKIAGAIHLNPETLLFRYMNCVNLESLIEQHMTHIHTITTTGG